MKKITLTIALLLTSSVLYAKPYNCTAYFKEKVVEKMKVNASKDVVAEEKAADRLRKKGVEVDYVQCDD